MAAATHRRALGALFLLLALGFGGVAWAAGVAGEWVIVVAAAAMGLWLASLAFRALKPR